MKQGEFDSLAVELFSQHLNPFGFSVNVSKHCVFSRKANEYIYHFICPSMGRNGKWYDVRVFPHSPHIDPMFFSRFPDRLGIPTDRWSCLSDHDGVGLTQQQFDCTTAANLRNSISSEVGALLCNVAIPYLDRFQTVEDIIPVIRHPLFMGFALYHVGRVEEAVHRLKSERERLQGLDKSDRNVASLLEHIERLLRKTT